MVIFDRKGIFLDAKTIYYEIKSFRFKYVILRKNQKFCEKWGQKSTNLIQPGTQKRKGRA